MDHIPGSGAVGVYEGLENVRDVGKRPNVVYIPRYQNIKSTNSKYLRGYYFSGGSTRTGFLGGFQLATLGGGYPPGFGVQFKEAMKQLGPWQMSLGGAGECLPYYENRVELNKNVVDKWGIPVPHITATWYENELAMYGEIRHQAAEMLEACGCKNVTTWGDARPGPPGKGIHEMGTARMGNDPKTSVLNRWNQCHDIKNLFVTDGSLWFRQPARILRSPIWRSLPAPPTTLWLSCKEENCESLSSVPPAVLREPDERAL